MTDANYWKERYKDMWGAASRRERAVAERIHQETGRVVVPVGLGTGTSAYLSGSARSHGREKGGADLRVEGTPVYLEVTGPHSPRVPLAAPLWLRPDKVRNARDHCADHETWIVHWLEQAHTLRVIRLDADFFACCDAGEFRIVTPQIRGTPETYLEVPANHTCVRAWQALIDRLRQEV